MHSTVTSRLILKRRHKIIAERYTLTMAQDTKVTLYWLEQSRSQRILWLLEELNIPYELKTFKRGPDMLAPQELKDVHPLGKSPIIGIENANTTKPLILAESAFITEYLCDHFNGERLVPKRYKEGKEGEIGAETDEWIRYRYYMHYAEGSLMPFLLLSLVMNGVRNAPVPFFVKPLTSIVASKVESAFINRNIDNHFRFLDEQLKTAPGGGPYLCGKELTAADILISFPIIAAMVRLPEGAEKYPNVKAYADLLQGTEGYKKAATKIEEVEGKFEAIMS